MKTIVKTYLAVIEISLVCFVLLPNVQAVVPPPDGGYPNFTTAEGTNALKNLTSGAGNTGVGWSSLLNVTTASFNTATGAGTLVLNTGNENTATGAAALLSNTIGEFNTATGAFALFSNQESNRNNAVGDRALFSHTSGDYNNAVGTFALSSDIGGTQNNAFGDEALNSNTIGAANTAVGDNALHSNTTGSLNAAIGALALYSNVGGNFNTALGAGAGSSVTGNSNICVGNSVLGVAGENNRIRIGDNLPTGSGQSACYIGGIAGQTVGAGGGTCYVDNAGKLGVFLSARRYKENIRPMDDRSAALFSLKPVTFRYKPEYDKSGTPHFGLIAEEVAEVAPDLVIRNAKGEISTVRYEAVNAMLLNEFLKEHRKMQELEATVVQQQKAVDALIAHIKEQDSKIQNVTDQLEMSKATEQVATIK
jgi:hypothetical protein